MQHVQANTPQAPAAFLAGKPVAVGSPGYNAIVTFLYEEAALLDQIRLNEWAQTLATDLVYTVPLRHTRSSAEQGASIVRTVQHYHDDYRSILGRILRLSGKSAWAEDPPSRTRRLVSNIMVAETAVANELEVRSYLLMTRSRFHFPEVDVISAERRDLVRQEADGSLRLARREVIIDQAVLGTPNLAVFL
jgi:3-phenylpropionate/cinnamic acid dioxygenase small subunit